MIESYRAPQVRKLAHLVSEKPGITKDELLQELSCDEHNFKRIQDAYRYRGMGFRIERFGKDGKGSRYFPLTP